MQPAFVPNIRLRIPLNPLILHPIMITPITITFPLNFFNPEKFGLTKAQADNDPGRFANNVAESLGRYFRRSARMPVLPSPRAR